MGGGGRAVYYVRIKFCFCKNNKGIIIIGVDSPAGLLKLPVVGSTDTFCTMLVHQGGASRAPLLVHVPRAYPRREPDSRSMHGEHSRTSLRRHARTSIITVLYTTHHSCILLATSFTHNTLLLTWPRSSERRGFFLYPGAGV